MGDYFALIWLILALSWTWLVIGRIFKISFGKSIKAWLPVLVLQLPLSLPYMIILPAYLRSRGLQISTSSMSNLLGIGKSIEIYKTNNDDNFPPSLDKLIETGEVTEKMLHYPGVSVYKPRSYFYLPPQKKGEDADYHTIIICEKKNVNTTGKGRNILFANITVRFFSTEEFIAELAKPQNAAFAAALKQAEGP